ncbi:MAG: hypothetical protein D6741_10815, partial [Planctomycetota bacterium]
MLQRFDRLACLVFLCGLCALSADGRGATAMETFRLRVEAGEVEVAGRVIATGQDGSRMLLGQDGRLWTIMPGDVLAHTEDDRPFEGVSKDEMARILLAELP